MATVVVVLIEVVANKGGIATKFMLPLLLCTESGEFGAEDEAETGELLRLEPVELGVS